MRTDIRLQYNAIITGDANIDKGVNSTSYEHIELV